MSNLQQEYTFTECYKEPLFTYSTKTTVTMNCHQSIEEDSNEECIMFNADNTSYLTSQTVQFDHRLNSNQNDEEVRDLVIHKSPSGIISLGRPTTLPTTLMVSQRKFIIDLLSSRSNSNKSINVSINALRENHMAHIQKKRNREMGNDALSLVLSALYAKFIFVLGIAFPITGIVADKAPTTFYQGFYLFLYTVSVLFVIFVYSTHLKNRQVFSMIDHYEERTGDTKLSTKKRIIRYGSFYLRVGAIAFGIGSMVYSGLEFGQYFELKEDDRCQNLLIAVNPAARMLLTIVQMQFIFLNTKELNMTRYKVISRFGLMHLVATNLCEWIYVLVEETKHEIENFVHQHSINNTSSHLIHKRATSSSIFVECKRTNIMGRLVQKAAPFLFPCTIEYSLICAVILYEMWKKIKMRDPSTREHQDSIMGHHRHKDVRQLSVDCSKAHRGMFAGILVIVLTIISLIMFYVLKEEKLYKATAVVEVTYCEILLYSLTSIAVLLAMRQMRDMKFSKLYVSGIGLDCTLLVLAQSGVYIYSMFSLLALFFTLQDNPSNMSGLMTESLSLIQTTIQTIFILNAWWRRTKGIKQNRTKPGREIITFLIVANMAIWFINCLIKNRASFRPTHLSFFGEWSWTIITHTSMPLAIFYRFHSTICLFEIWKTSYKLKEDLEDKNQMQH